MTGGYRVITLCGSTRFREAFLQEQKRLTLEGNIVISVGLFGHAGDSEVWEGMDEGTLTSNKEMLDDMHKRKIDMADGIHVINVGGYIGQSTRSEIAYALSRGKQVTYLEPPREDKRSFILGMITAFCECVAAGCKDLALSPPLTAEDYALYRADAEDLIEKHGLLHARERNEDLPEEERFEWILIAARQQTLEEYRALRARGFSPARSLAPFAGVLSYDAEKSVSNGFDAYRERFPLGR